MRKTPIKHRVRSHKRKGKKVDSYIRGSGSKSTKISVPELDVHTAHENTLKQRAIDTVITNYYAYQGSLDEEDIYNDFNDELYESLEDEKMPEKDIDFIMKFINTREFWDRLYTQEPSMKGNIMW